MQDSKNDCEIAIIVPVYNEEDNLVRLKAHSIFQRNAPVYSHINQTSHGEIKQVPVRHFPRMAGKAKYHFF